MREIVLRAAGALLFVGAAFLWGQSEIRAGRRRIRELEAAGALCRFIRQNIERLATPLPDIFAAYEDPVLSAIGFLPILRREGFRAAVEGADWEIGEAERAVLCSFADALGRGFREEQVSLCRYTEDRIADAADALKKSAPDRERLWRSIPVLGALSALLMLM